MPSLMEEGIAKRQEFLAKFRISYLCSVGREMGFMNSPDLRDLALREAAALIELARELSPPR
jgi:hypothetical protein